MSTSGLVRLDSVQPERVSWLWPGRLPAGKLVVLDGDPSTGKSTLTLDLAAHVSTGRTWPDGAPCPVGDVLLLSAEDGLGDTIAPRLVAAGADRSRVHALTEVALLDEEGEVRMVPPSLPRDVGTLRTILTQHRIRLLIIDVFVAYLSGGVDAHRDQDVRGVLHQLAAVAEESGCAVLLIRHLNKAGGSQALYRGGGSIGIVGAARAAYLVARDPEDDARRILAPTKCNLAAEPPALAYRLVDDPTNGCARLEWEPGTVALTAAQLLRPPEDEDDRTERDAAAEWLIDYLTRTGGSAGAREVLASGRRDGYAERTLQRARKRAGVITRKAGMGGGWEWTLEVTSHEWEPRRRHEGAEDASSHGLAPTAPSVPTVAPSVGSECAVCQRPMSLAEPGQTTHPTCTPRQTAAADRARESWGLPTEETR